VTPEELALIAGFLRESCGLELDNSKAYLVEGRLHPLLAEERCSSYFELYQRARADATGRLASRLIDTITTKETSFYREGAHFDLLRNTLLTAHVSRVRQTGAGRTLDIWSAGCASGQEAYSIAMAVHEALEDPGAWQVRIVGTDLSESALAQAQSGVYSQLEVDRGLTPEQALRYLEPVGGRFRICAELGRYTRFQRLNLLEIPSGWGRFDVIFCRNVAIYFNPDTRRRLFARLADCLQPHGALVIGSTESLVGVDERLAIEWAAGTSYYRVVAGPPT
jgi:chemotaxis protein methyltransferase CheR